jgi:hypothetical protein
MWYAPIYELYLLNLMVGYEMRLRTHSQYQLYTYLEATQHMTYYWYAIDYTDQDEHK